MKIQMGMLFGSSLAAYMILKRFGKKVDLIIPVFPETYKYLGHVDETKKAGEEGKVYDLAIALDCADIKRLDDPNGNFELANVTVNIDHHSSNSMFADYNYV